MAGKKKSGGRKASFADIFAREGPEVQRLGVRLRRLVQKVLPEAEETVLPRARLVLYKVEKEICGIQPAGDRCNFYLSEGARLKDPGGLLEGRGKSIRHVKVYAERPLPAPSLAGLLREARELH